MMTTATSLVRGRLCAPELVLDFFWLLFTKASLADNVDGYVSKDLLGLT
jgi:hypothetical protein